MVNGSMTPTPGEGLGLTIRQPLEDRSRRIGDGVSLQAQRTSRDSFKVASLNIRGRVCTAQGYRQDKWFELNRVINTHRIAVLAVQETHLTDELAASFETAFGSRLKLFHSPLQETRNAAGVAIVINKGLINANEIKCTTLIPGRALLVEIPWHAGSKIKVLDVYAPNDAKENEIFWEKIDEITSDDPALKPDIMLGDCNLVEDSLDRLPCHPDNPNAVASLGILKGNLDLVDGWRRTFPDRREYSHTHAPNASQGRIDRIYITNALLSPACDWKIDSTTIETDHWMVSVNVSSPEAPLIGKGRWQIPKIGRAHV